MFINVFNKNCVALSIILLSLPACRKQLGIVPASINSSVQAPVITQHIVEQADTSKFLTQIILPINHTLPEKEHVSLKISIPADFKSITGLGSETMEEFIPKVDKNEYEWSKIITVHKFLGKSLQAKMVTENLINGFKAQAQDVLVIANPSQIFKNYNASALTMMYTHNNRTEVLFAAYFSGPVDCVGYQYAMLVDKNIGVLPLANSMKDFQRNNIELINAK